MLHDLGLIHFDLGEYNQALQQFLKILEIVSADSGSFNQAMCQAGLVLEEMARRKLNGQRRRKKKKKETKRGKDRKLFRR